MRFIIIYILGAFLISCCKGESQSDALNLHYPNLTETVELFAIRTERSDISSVIDTISFGELNSNNKYSFGGLGFDSSSPNHIFYTENGLYRDTISDIYIEIEFKKCKDELTRFEYKLNGVLQSSHDIYIE